MSMKRMSVSAANQTVVPTLIPNTDVDWETPTVKSPPVNAPGKEISVLVEKDKKYWKKERNRR